MLHPVTSETIYFFWFILFYSSLATHIDFNQFQHKFQNKLKNIAHDNFQKRLIHTTHTSTQTGAHIGIRYIRAHINQLNSTEAQTQIPHTIIYFHRDFYTIHSFLYFISFFFVLGNYIFIFFILNTEMKWQICISHFFFSFNWVVFLLLYTLISTILFFFYKCK